MHVFASVKVFIKQLGLSLAVARRRARQLQMAGKGTSQWAGSKQTGAAVTWGHSERAGAYVMGQRYCSVDITREVGINKMSL